jgi:D-alanyl-D-alanine carboxypeptidase
MSSLKVSPFNNLLINLLIFITNLLSLIDFKLRTLFILFNVTLSAYLLFFYAKPTLDNYYRSPIIISNENFDAKTALNKPAVTETTPATVPARKIYSLNNPQLVKAKSFIVYDVLSGKEVYSINKDLQLPPASLVKMLSTMIFIDKIDLKEMYTVSSECMFVDGQKIGFKNQEKVSGKDLIYSSLVYSAGDSICNLYKATKSSIPELNDFAKTLGMKNSNFTNFIGLDFNGNFTTAEDILILSKKFIENSVLNEVVATKSYTLENKKFILNTNKMLFEEKRTVGIKTGTTEGANQNLVYRIKDKEKDEDFIIVILNSSDRYSDIKNILKNLN